MKSEMEENAMKKKKMENICDALKEIILQIILSLPLPPHVT